GGERGFGRRCARERARQHHQGQRGRPDQRHPYAAALVRFSATLSRKPVVDSQRWSAPTKSARSLVMKPASTVSTQTFSSVAANFSSSALLSSLARCDRPRVQAKIEAIELVEVSLPF